MHNYRKIFSLLLVTLVFCTSIRPQEQFVEPPAKMLTSFPFVQLSGGVIMLRAQFGNFEDTLNFILDTGSGGISLDSTTVSYFGIVPEPSDMTILGIGGLRKVNFLYNQRLRLPGLTVDSLNFHINNYEILTMVYGEKVDGIIGFSVLNRYIFRLNYDSSRISIFSHGRMKYPRGGWMYEPVLRTMPVQEARVKDARTINTRFLFDIGAGLCLMFSKEFVNDSNIISKKRVLFSKEAEGVGGKVDMKLTVVREVKLGPYRFKQVPTFIFDDVYNVTSYPYLGGLIGNDLLRRFNVYLNYDKKEFYFTPNSHYNDLFDYAYSGLELYFVDGHIELGDVADGSPASQAGLQEGDIVVGINNNLSGNFMQYKAALQVANQKIKMIVSRNGELLVVEFKTKSIR